MSQYDDSAIKCYLKKMNIFTNLQQYKTETSVLVYITVTKKIFELLNNKWLNFSNSEDRHKIIYVLKYFLKILNEECKDKDANKKQKDSSKKLTFYTDSVDTKENISTEDKQIWKTITIIQLDKKDNVDLILKKSNDSEDTEKSENLKNKKNSELKEFHEDDISLEKKIMKILENDLTQDNTLTVSLLLMSEDY